MKFEKENLELAIKAKEFIESQHEDDEDFDVDYWDYDQIIDYIKENFEGGLQSFLKSIGREQRTYQELTDKEENIFFDEFYSMMSAYRDDDDRDSPYPWGAPWYNFSDDYLLHEKIEFAAQRYFDECLPELERLWLIEDEHNDQE